jgi:hypothetical protein
MNINRAGSFNSQEIVDYLKQSVANEVVNNNQLEPRPKANEVASKPADNWRPTPLQSRQSFQSLQLAAQIKGTIAKERPLRFLPEPTLLSKDQNDEEIVFRRPENAGLFINGVKPGDALMGNINDDYLMADLAAVAKVNPNAIRDAIRDNGDGTYTVRLYNYDNATGETKPEFLLVDGRLATYKGSNQPLYGHSPRNRDGKMELWPAILEKAIAALKGGYENITFRDFFAQNAMSMITGTRRNTYYQLSFNRITQFANSGHPITAYHSQPSDDSTPSGPFGSLIEGQNYTVLGTGIKNGQQMIRLRSPLGSYEPGNDGKNDGIFQITYQEYQKYFTTNVGRTKAEEEKIQNYRTLVEPTLGKSLQNPTLDYPAVTYQRAEDLNLIPSLFGNQVKPTDVVSSGLLNDSSVVASFASIAKTNPEVIKQAICDNHDGTYTVRLYNFDRGKAIPRFVTVDSKFPRFDNHIQPIYAQSPYNGNEITLWPTILEKAIASDFGGYDKIENNFATGTVLAMLTGKPINVDPNNFINFDNIIFTVRAKQASLAATYDNNIVSEQELKNAQLMPNYSYSIIDAGTDEDGKQFVTVRDPRGPFANVGNNDGLIKLSYNDFKKFFANFSFSDL